jgi:hypothetical protein
MSLESDADRAERYRKALEALAGALSRIDYLCGEPNEMEVSGYDIHCDEEAVVRAVTRLRADPRLALTSEQLSEVWAMAAAYHQEPRDRDRAEQDALDALERVLTALARGDSPTGDQGPVGMSAEEAEATLNRAKRRALSKLSKRGEP